MRRLWRPLRRWAIEQWIWHEWVPWAEALDRIQAKSRSREVAQVDLLKLIHVEKVETALRHVLSDGTNTASRLPVRGFWRHFEPERRWSGRAEYNAEHQLLRGSFKGHTLTSGSWHFFVRRAHLDEHYPPPTLAAVAPPASTAVKPEQLQQLRRTPGIKPSKDWPLHVGAELVRLQRDDPQVLRDPDKLLNHVVTFMAKVLGVKLSEDRHISRVIDILLSRL
jgi:hypothetical protein